MPVITNKNVLCLTMTLTFLLFVIFYMRNFLIGLKTGVWREECVPRLVNIQMLSLLSL